MVIKSKSSIELHNIENSFERKKHVWFSGMDKLDTLNLNNNKIEELGPRFFEGDSSHVAQSWINWWSLLLRDAPGHITEARLQQDQQDSRWSLLWPWRLAKTYLKRCLTLMSPITEQLQSLSLQSNKISRFPTASLRPLHQLKTLHLNDNNVSSWVIFF